MSERASELLRELEPHTITLEGQWKLRRALPEIIAVVEAAETSVAHEGWERIEEALDALAAKLSGETG